MAEHSVSSPGAARVHVLTEGQIPLPITGAAPVSRGPFPPSVRPRPDPWGPVRFRVAASPTKAQRCGPAQAAPHLRGAEPCPHLSLQEGLQPAAGRAEEPPAPRRRHLVPPRVPQRRDRPSSGRPYGGKPSRGRFTAKRVYHRDGRGRSEGPSVQAVR